MKDATVPPKPGIAPIMVPINDPLSSTVQCLNTATTPCHKPVKLPDIHPLRKATDPPFKESSIIWLIAKSPVSVGTNGIPSHK